MWLNYAKLSAASYEKVCKTPSLVEALFFDSELSAPSDFDPDKDVFGEDYLAMSGVLELDEDEVEEVGLDVATLKEALGEGAGTPIDYEFCYGNGFAFSPTEVASLAKKLKKSPDGLGISEFFQAAAKEKKGIIGGIS